MNQFVVPQFIDIEDKIIGPITTRQFIMLCVAGMLSIISYRLADFVLFLTETVLYFIVIGFTAFFKVNGRPMHYFLLNILQTMKRPRLKVWKRELDNLAIRQSIINKKIAPPTIIGPSKKQLGLSRLAELSLVVDTGGIYQEGKNW